MDKDRVEGSWEQAKGKVKEVAGKVTGDAKTEAEGKAQKTAGKIQNAVGGLKDTLRGDKQSAEQNWRSPVPQGAGLFVGGAWPETSARAFCHSGGVARSRCYWRIPAGRTGQRRTPPPGPSRRVSSIRARSCSPPRCASSLRRPALWRTSRSFRSRR